jgi:hypothetical protein
VAKTNGGGYAILDGQTRWLALGADTGTIHPESDGNVDVEIFDDLTHPEAALLFRLRNQQRPVSPKDRDRIAVVEGDPIDRRVAEGRS